MPLNSSYPRLPDTSILENYPLYKLSTLRTGGTAELFAQPESASQLQQLIRSAQDCPVNIIGGGSNIIIPDGNIPGLTISTLKLSTITWHGDFTAEIGSGFPLPHLVRELRSKQLGGLEFAAGIPGTLGGAISGNAGAGGRGVCEYVDSLAIMDSSGTLTVLRRGEFEYGYRRCSVSGAVIVSAVMSFTEGEMWDETAYSDFMAKRRTQPLDSHSAGCTFKNPPGHSAGKLLDECGCKGLTEGGASVSEKHANFIVNSGGASSSDVMRLAEKCAMIVRERTGVILEPEIKTLSPCFGAQ